MADDIPDIEDHTLDTVFTATGVINPTTPAYDASAGTTSIADLIAQGVIPKPPGAKAPAPVHAAFQAAAASHPPTAAAAAHVAAAVAPVAPPAKSYTAYEIVAGAVLALGTFLFLRRKK